jgi:ADP-ribose pyrophosphatase YjhB (NUDIX family)
VPTEPRFCIHCGASLERRYLGDEPVPRHVCTNPSCGQIAYRNSIPAAGALIEREGELLLVQRGIQPYRGMWDIPGGFLEEWEHPAEAAVREAREETGLEVELTALLGIFMGTYGPEGNVVLSVFYRARVIGGEVQAGDDAAGAAWFRPDELPAEVAFNDIQGPVLACWKEAFQRDPNPTSDAECVVYTTPGVRRLRPE